MIFNPTKYEMACCKDVIWSRYPGEYRKCSCGHSAVEETEMHYRIIGAISRKIGRLNDESEERGASKE